MSEQPEYLICKYGLYYRPNAQGYTGVKAQAGLYTLRDAIGHSHPNGPDGPRDGMSYVHQNEAPDFSPRCCSAVKAEWLLKKEPRHD